MKFYIDFEATRFSERIISIGCVAENNATFQTLVKPVNKGKVDNFITELTGITNEMLALAPTADEAFNRLFDFIELNNNDTMPEFYIYSSSDISFLSHTTKFMKDARATMCALAIQGTAIDFAIPVRQYFKANSDFSLRKVYMLINSKTELVQRHDALEDALMLKNVAENLYKKCNPDDKEKLAAIPSQKRPGQERKKAPEIFVSWDKFSKWEAPTNKNTWYIKAKDQHSNKEKYFTDLDVAALWIIKYSGVKMSPKKTENIEKIKNAIINSANNKKCRYNCYWEINETVKEN